MDSSTPRPAPDHPDWGPPRGQAPVATPRSQATGRRHPAARARRVAGWAAVASSAALVGYMVTANADTAATQSVPVVKAPTRATGEDGIPAINTPVVNTPAPINLPQARPAFPAQPSSSTHGS
jgi:hypothetical protein